MCFFPSSSHLKCLTSSMILFEIANDKNHFKWEKKKNDWRNWSGEKRRRIIAWIWNNVDFHSFDHHNPLPNCSYSLFATISVQKSIVQNGNSWKTQIIINERYDSRRFIYSVRVANDCSEKRTGEKKRKEIETKLIAMWCLEAICGENFSATDGPNLIFDQFVGRIKSTANVSNVWDAVDRHLLLW